VSAPMPYQNGGPRVTSIVSGPMRRAWLRKRAGRIAARDAHAVGWKMKREQEESLIAKRNPLPEGSGGGSQISSALARSYEHRHTGTAVA
jgi:hypothetical protein